MKIWSVSGGNTMVGTTIDGAAPSLPPQLRPARHMALMLIAVVVAVVLAAGSWYWVTHPQALEGYGNAEGGPAARGRVFSEVMLFPRDEGGSAHLTVTSLKPRIEENTAGAVFVILICRSNVANPTLTMGAIPESPASSCSQLRPLKGGEGRSLDFPNTRIIAQITTSRPGRLHFAGYDISYRQGIRWGHQQVGIDSTFTVS